MKLIIQTCLLVACILSRNGLAAELPPAEVQSVAVTAIQWLAFDEWGTRTPDDPYHGRKINWLRRQREHLAKRTDTPLPVEAFFVGSAVLNGQYNLSKRSLEVTDVKPKIGWSPGCLYIGISPDARDAWRVELKLSSIWSYIKIARDGEGYYVSAYDQTWIVD